MSYKSSSNLLRVLIYVALAILMIITLAPIWMLLVNATRSTVQIQQGLSFVPSTHMFENYAILVGRGLNLPRGFVNSTFVAVSVTVVSVYFSLLTAYAIVVYNFPGKKLFYSFILVLVMLPLQLSIIGFFQYMSRLGLTDTYVPLILPAIASAGAVFFGKQYLESVVIGDSDRRRPDRRRRRTGDFSSDHDADCRAGGLHDGHLRLCRLLE